MVGRTEIEEGQGGAGDPLVVYPRRWKLALLALAALAFVFLGLWIGGLFGRAQASIGIVIVTTYVGVPFFISSHRISPAPIAEALSYIPS